MTFTLFAGVVAGLLLTIRMPALQAPASVRGLAFATVGAASGAAVNSHVLATIAHRPLIAMGGVVATLAASLLIGQLLRLNRGVSPATALFSSIAGGASGITLLAKEYGADDATVLSVQYLRVMAVIVSVPLVAPFLGAGNGGVVIPDHASLGTDALLVLFAVGGGLVLARLLALPAAQVLIPLLLSATVSVSGLLPGASVPSWLLAGAYAGVGLTVGLGLNPERLRRLARLLPLAAVQIVVSVAVCTLIGIVFARAAGISALDGYLATTPGGLPAVAAITLQIGHEVGLILSMQVLRLFLALLLAPVLGTLLLRRAARATGVSPTTVAPCECKPSSRTP